jgi:hypothetical protein
MQIKSRVVTFSTLFGLAEWSALAAFLVVLLLAMPRLAVAQGEIAISEFTHQGNGCRPGTVSHAVSGDGQAITVFFSDYVVSTDRRRVAHKNCNLSITVQSEPGWEFSVVGADIRGFANISERAVGRFAIRHNFDAEPGPTFQDTVINGPSVGEFLTQVALTPEQARWSGCRPGPHKLRLGTSASVAMRRGGSGSMMSVDSVDGELRQRYMLRWRACTGSQNEPGSVVRAQCRVWLVGQRGNRITQFPGIGRGPSAEVATAQATREALNLCDVARRIRPQFTCEVEPSSCRNSSN